VNSNLQQTHCAVIILKTEVTVHHWMDANLKCFPYLKFSRWSALTDNQRCQIY